MIQYMRLLNKVTTTAAPASRRFGLRGVIRIRALRRESHMLASASRGQPLEVSPDAAF